MSLFKGANAKARFTLTIWIGGWLMIAAPLAEIWWGLAAIWVGLGLLSLGGLQFLGRLFWGGIGQYPASDWFKNAAGEDV